MAGNDLHRTESISDLVRADQRNTPHFLKRRIIQRAKSGAQVNVVGNAPSCYICRIRHKVRKSRTEYMGMSVRSTVTTVFKQVAAEQQRTLVPISDDLKLLESGLDSLSFAIIVAKLEDEVGFGSVQFR